MAAQGARALARALLVLAWIGAASALPWPAAADESHGLSSFGDLAYPPDFRHFAYADPAAPKGGEITLIGTQAQNSFDSLNAFILKGVPAEGMGRTFDSLMVRAFDEPDALYGLVAEKVEYPPGREWALFTLRPEARFHDGTPLTAEDVVASFFLLKQEGAPVYRVLLRDVVAAEALGRHRVKYRFSGENRRDLPLIVASLPIFSKAYYAAHPFAETTTVPPLGSGPYRVAKVDLGRSVTFERVTDYWGRDLPVNAGRHNFDRIRYDYFRDRSAALEAFKAGAYDLREEFTAKSWVTEYDFPALRQGLVKRAVLEDAQPSGVQGFFLNTRRQKFQDRRVREALDLAFDFAWTNKALFHGQYERTDSIFENSDLAAQGLPSPAELALLEPFRDRLDPAVFGPAYVPPQTDGSGRNRDNLRRAQELLERAGWRVSDGALRDARGTPFTIEFLGFETTFERVVAPYIRNLARLGIRASFRLVDMAQYQRRVQEFDFDVTTSRFVQPNTPGIEQRNYWSCAAAQVVGSFNLAGICDPAVDALVEAIIRARSRAELRAATRALDRVVMHGRYLVPHWYKGSHWVAYWDKFDHPPVKPKYDRGILDLWWYASDKAARHAAARR